MAQHVDDSAGATVSRSSVFKCDLAHTDLGNIVSDGDDARSVHAYVAALCRCPMSLPYVAARLRKNSATTTPKNSPRMAASARESIHQPGSFQPDAISPLDTRSA